MSFRVAMETKMNWQTCPECSFYPLGFSEKSESELWDCPSCGAMGGYAWRAGYAAALAEATSREVAIVHVDAGRAFAGELLPSGEAAVDVRIKNEWMLRSFARMRATAVNVAHADLAFLAAMMKRRGYAGRAQRFPALGKLLSTNVVPASSSVRPFRPFAVDVFTFEGATIKEITSFIARASDVEEEKIALWPH